VDTRCIESFDICGYQVHSAMSDENVDESLVCDCVRNGTARVALDRFENSDSLVEILLNTARSIDKGRPMSSLNRDSAICFELSEYVLHCMNVDWLDGSISIKEQLIRVCVCSTFFTSEEIGPSMCS